MSETPFAGSLLPGSIDLAGLPAGPYLLCVRDDGSVPPAVECGPIAPAGETSLVLDGSGCGADPLAALDLGPLTCVESRSPDRSTLGHEDAAEPAPGEGCFYLIEYDDGVTRTLGSDTALKPRLPESGGNASGC